MAYINTLFIRKGAKQFAVLLLLSFILISCGNFTPSPVCVASGDLGNVTSATVSVDSTNSGWVDGGIDVTSGDNLTLSVSGDVDLCLSQSQGFSPVSTNSGWQDTGITITSGVSYAIGVTGQYTLWGGAVTSTTCGTPPDANYFDPDCWLRQGKGLYAFIGPTPPNASTLPPGSSTTGPSNGIFELFNRSTSTPGYSSLAMTTTGHLWLRYSDCIGGWSCPYGDNQGAYRVTVAPTLSSGTATTQTCHGSSGQFLQYKVIPSGGNCADLGAVTGTDVGTGSVVATTTTPAGSSATTPAGSSTISFSAPSTGRVCLHINDTNNMPNGDGDYSKYTGPSAVTLTQCTVTSFISNNNTSASNPAMTNLQACVIYLNSLFTTPAVTAGGTNLPAQGATIYGSMATISSSSACSVTGISANDGISNSFATLPLNPSPQTLAEKCLTLVTNALGNGLTASSSPIVASSGSNYGSYLVTLSTPKQANTAFLTIISNIIDPIRSILRGNTATNTKGLTQKMYEGLAWNGEFINGVRALMILVIVFFGFQYMVGLSKITHVELLYLTIKMSIVIAMMGPDSWNFFTTYLFGLFITGTDNLIYIMTNNINNIISQNTSIGASFTGGSASSPMQTSGTFSGKDQVYNIFGFLNYTLSIIFSKETNIKLSAVLVTFPVGPFIVLTMYMGIAFFVISVIKALFAYVVSIIMVSLLLFMAPIFICFILFKSTKEIFDRWIREIATFALQPVLLFVLLSVFNLFILTSIFTILGFSACYTCVWEVDLPISEALKSATNFDRFCAIYGYLPWGMDTSLGVTQKMAKTPIGLFFVLIFIILVNLMLKFTEFVSGLSNALVGDGTAVGLTPSIAKASGEISGMARTVAASGMNTAKFAARNIDRATGHVFSDSGIKMARSVLPRMLTKGGTDKMGQKLDISENFMTSREKKGYERQKQAFNNLSSIEQKAVRDLNLDKRAEAKVDKQLLKEETKKRLASLPKGEDTSAKRAEILKNYRSGMKDLRDSSRRNTITSKKLSDMSGGSVFEARNNLATQKIRDTLNIPKNYARQEGESVGDALKRQLDARAKVAAEQKGREAEASKAFQEKGFFKRLTSSGELIVQENKIRKEKAEIQEAGAASLENSRKLNKALLQHGGNGATLGERIRSLGSKERLNKIRYENDQKAEAKREEEKNKAAQEIASNRRDVKFKDGDTTGNIKVGFVRRNDLAGRLFGLTRAEVLTDEKPNTAAAPAETHTPTPKATPTAANPSSSLQSEAMVLSNPGTNQAGNNPRANQAGANPGANQEGNNPRANQEGTKPGTNQADAGVKDPKKEAYKTLGIDEKASIEDANKAYKKLLLQNHPDKIQQRGGDAKAILEAKENSQKINNAWGVIKDSFSEN